MLSEVLQFMFLILRFSLGYGSAQQIFIMHESREKTNITDLSLWSRSGADTSIGCAIDCARDIQCVSFFYNTRTYVCTAHGVRFFETSPIVSGVTDMGSLYFTRSVLTRDCADILSNSPNAPDGVYVINPHDGKGPLRVYCDMSTDGGGWTVFQRRTELSDFNRNWTEYALGFGNITRDFWLGNDALHRLTVADCELRIDMMNESDTSFHAKYSTFRVANESAYYRLTLSGFTGNCENGLSRNNNINFSTAERDNDDYPTFNCANDRQSGFWYWYCSHSNLNGFKNIVGDWNFDIILQRVEMKLRRHQLLPNKAE